MCSHLPDVIQMTRQNRTCPAREHDDITHTTNMKINEWHKNYCTHFASDIISFIICYLKHSGHFNQLQLIEIDLMKCATADVNDEWLHGYIANCAALLCLCFLQAERNVLGRNGWMQLKKRYRNTASNVNGWNECLKCFRCLCHRILCSSELKCLCEHTIYYN